MKKKWIGAVVISILIAAGIFLFIKNGIRYSELSHTELPPVSMENGFTDISDAQKAVPFAILEPEYLPTGFRFLGVHVAEEKITLIYEDSKGRRITISEWNSVKYEHQPYPGEREVMFNGIKGWFSVPGPYNLLWSCDSVIISLTADLSGGREIVLDEMIKIAESMQC